MGGVFLAEDLSLKFHGVSFALTGLGPFFAKHSQGDALGFRMAPRWGLGHCPAGELGKSTSDGVGSVFFSRHPKNSCGAGACILMDREGGGGRMGVISCNLSFFPVWNHLWGEGLWLRCDCIASGWRTGRVLLFAEEDP